MKGISYKKVTFRVIIGWLDIRRAVDIALPAFFSSMNSVRALTEAFLSRVDSLADEGDIIAEG